MATLRAVGKDEKPPVDSVMSVTQAASEGTDRQLLVAMRDRVAKAVENENTAARDLAALTKRLREITNDIRALDARESEEGTGAVDSPDEEFDAAKAL